MLCCTARRLISPRPAPPALLPQLVWLRNLTSQAVLHVPDSSLDYIYVDARQGRFVQGVDGSVLERAGC